VRVQEPIFDKRSIEDSFACRKGKGAHAGMRRALEHARRFTDWRRTLRVWRSEWPLGEAHAAFPPRQ
jgi:hypothetical protein